MNCPVEARAGAVLVSFLEILAELIQGCSFVGVKKFGTQCQTKSFFKVADIFHFSELW